MCIYVCMYVCMYVYIYIYIYYRDDKYQWVIMTRTKATARSDT